MFALRRFFISALFFVTTPIAWALPVPPLTGPVVDQAHLLDPQDQQAIERLIRSVNESGLAQLQVLTIPSLQEETIESYSIQVVDQWKLGKANEDNGALLLVALAEKKIRIEVGQGLEGVVPDIRAKRIIEDEMAPVFRQAGPSKGILIGVMALVKTIDPNWKFDQQLASQRPVRTGKRGLGHNIIVILFLIFFFKIFFLGGLPGRRLRRGWHAGGVGGWPGGGGFGGGGGGWSGGGGGFSGGGASGGW